jgi:epoxyqueuosine reductase
MTTAPLEDRLRSPCPRTGVRAGCALPVPPCRAQVGERLEQAVGDGHHGSMEWLADTAERRRSPDAMWTGARSAITLAMSYAPDLDPMQRLEAGI